MRNVLQQSIQVGLVLLFLLPACQQGPDRGQGLVQLPETPAETIYPEKDYLASPSLIDGWVTLVNSKVEEFEQKGPVTVSRQEGNYEVSAALAGGEIIMIYAVTPGSLSQHWYYLNQYLVPTLREKGRTREGEYFERRLYYSGPQRYLGGRERRAESPEALEDALWYKYIPEDGEVFFSNAEAVRSSALEFVNGR